MSEQLVARLDHLEAEVERLTDQHAMDTAGLESMGKQLRAAEAKLALLDSPALLEALAAWEHDEHCRAGPLENTLMHPTRSGRVTARKCGFT